MDETITQPKNAYCGNDEIGYKYIFGTGENTYGYEKIPEAKEEYFKVGNETNKALNKYY